MPSVTYKDKSGRKKTVTTAYTKAGKKKASRIAKAFGGKVASKKPKRMA